jgi:hypothetical protein
MGNILYLSREEKLLLSVENPKKKCHDRCFVEIIVCILFIGDSTSDLLWRSLNGDYFIDISHDH